MMFNIFVSNILIRILIRDGVSIHLNSSTRCLRVQWSAALQVTTLPLSVQNLACEK